jgi:hypothetical protein
MFPPKKKKPALDVAIAVGPAKKKPPMPPMDLESPGGMDDEEESSDHEASESPDEESSEDYGAKLISDIDAVGEAHGMDSMKTRAFTADLFDAVANCLRGEGDTVSGDDNATEEEDQGYR